MPSLRRPRPALAAIACCLGLTLATACSDDPEAGSSAGLPALDPTTLLLRADTRGEEARAGLPFKVDCRAFRKVDGQPGEEVALPWATTTTWLDGPAPPLQVGADALTLGALGLHRVGCRTIGGELEDAAGTPLPVVPGPPVSVETTLQGPDGPADLLSGGAPVKAGATVLALCSAQDALGHAIAEGFDLHSEPALAAQGLAIQTGPAGDFAVACRVQGTVDASPARLRVVAGVPKHLHTLLDPPQIEAGNATTLGCQARDAHGNVVPDFPFAVDHSDKLTLKGLYLSSTTAGLHSVRCVPESLAWELFTLHGAALEVAPGPPAALQVARLPAKGVYKRKETIKFAPTVRDAYGNVRADEDVAYGVDTPAKGYKDKGGFAIQFNVDAAYAVRFTVTAAPAVEQVVQVLVDGAPPLLTIDEPGWGSTLDGKPSVVVQGKAGDEGAGIKALQVNGKTAFVDAAGQWKVGTPAKHGLTMVQAEATDLGDETARAVRGFYYSGKYYPTDAGAPEAQLVDKAVQIFMGKDLFDDGVHDPSKPDDLATILEVVAGAMLKSSLLPSNMNQGDIEVALSNTKIGAIGVSLVPKTGGLAVEITVDDISTDLAVKAKLKLGPIKTSVKVSGDIEIAQVRLKTFLTMYVTDGKPYTNATQTVVKIDGMKLHVDGIAGLFDFLWNMLLKQYESTFETQIMALLTKELPKLMASAFDLLALNQSFEVPPLIGQGKTATLTLISRVEHLSFSELGAVLELDASVVAAKGVPHTNKGAIGRDGCVGTSPDAFAIDTSQRLQLALHDDLLNQVFYALWYSGALQLELPLAELTGESNFSGFSLEGATMALDFTLPPILEACNMPDPLKLRLQVGDLFATIRLLLGSDPLDLYTVVLADAGAQIALGQGADGQPALLASVDKELGLVVHLQDITKGWEDQKPSFQNLLTTMLTKALGDGALPVDKPLEVPLPPTALDLSAALPGLPPGLKITVALGALDRKGGYTSVTATLQ